MSDRMRDRIAMSMKHRIALVIVTEVLFMTCTRAVLNYFPWSSVEAELIRSGLRIITIGIYWSLFETLILSRKPDYSAFRNWQVLLGVLLFLSIPFAVGDYQLESSAALLFAISSAPIAVREEILFRGIAQNLLVQKYGSLKGVLLTSALFTASHIGVWKPTIWIFAQIFFASLLIGLIYIYSGSILAAITIHFAYDALFSFTPLVSTPLQANWGFIPLLTSLALVSYWALKKHEGARP